MSQDDRSKRTVLSLEPSEAAVLRGACDLYAAYIAAGQVSDDNRDEMMDRAVRETIRMAVTIDNAVAGDEEVKTRINRPAF